MSFAHDYYANIVSSFDRKHFLFSPLLALPYLLPRCLLAGAQRNPKFYAFENGLCLLVTGK